MKSKLAACMALSCSLVTACVDDPPATELRYESWYCGRSTCDLNEALATGSSLILTARAGRLDDRLSTASIESSDPSIVEIGVVKADELTLRAEVIGLAEGDVELLVLDEEGALLGTMPLRVRTADRLDLAFSLVTYGVFEELPTPAPGIDRELDVSANTRIGIETIAMAGDEPLLGIYPDHVVEVRSTAPADEQPQPRAEDAKFGRFDVRVSAYDHDLTIRRRDLATTIRLHGRDTLVPTN